MVFIVYKVFGAECKSRNARVWVATDDLLEAEELAGSRMVEEGFQIVKKIEITLTIEADYFPPCKSLDAYFEAEADGIAIRYD